MMTKRNNTMTAPAVDQDCTAARKKACSNTNRPAMEIIVSTRNMALVMGLRLTGFATTSNPQRSVNGCKDIKEDVSRVHSLIDPTQGSLEKSRKRFIPPARS
jgi:hypothetical protein